MLQEQSRRSFPRQEPTVFKMIPEHREDYYSVLRDTIVTGKHKIHNRISNYRLTFFFKLTLLEITHNKEMNDFLVTLTLTIAYLYLMKKKINK